MNIEQLLQLLDSVKRQGNQYMARCPAHHDKKASLSISEGADGRILLYCHAGCSHDEIVSALGLKKSDLFPEPEKPKRKKVICEYLYTNLAGEVLHKKIRYSDKSFTQARPNGSKWVYSLKGIDPVLYNLPAVTKAIITGETIYLPEGEKDCDNLQLLGKVATTNTEGAGRGKWKQIYSETLTGANVVILPDHDDVGKAFAIEKADSLQGIAASVRLCNLMAIWPDIPEKGDISDLIDHFGPDGALNLLNQYVAELPEYEPLTDESGSEQIDDKFFILPAKNGFKVSPALLAVYIKQKHDIRFFKTHFRIRKNHYYSLVENMRAVISNEIPEDLRVPANIRDSEELLMMDQGIILSENELASENYISFKNGVLNVETLEFFSHEEGFAKDLIFINQINYNWDPEVKPDPLTDNFFHNATDGKQDDINFLFQVLGVAMSGYRDFKHIFYFTGIKDSGKSQFLNLIQALLTNGDGSFDYCNIPLQILTDQSSKEFIRIIGKRANISGETPDLKVFNDSLLKQLTGGDRVNAQVKFKDNVDFVNKAILIFAGNTVPNFFVSDKSSIGERLLIYAFKNATPPEKQINNIYKHMNMEYVIKHAVEQLRIFVSNNQRFTIPQEIHENRERMETDSDVIYKFFRENVTLTSDERERISTTALYDEFLWFLVGEGHIPMDQYSHKPDLSKTKVSQYIFIKRMKSYIGEERYRRSLAIEMGTSNCFVGVLTTGMIKSRGNLAVINGNVIEGILEGKPGKYEFEC